jgi:hypothetical protein
MESFERYNLTLEHRLLFHPRAFHLRRMRLGLWLYLALLARSDGGEFDIDPTAFAAEMGIAEGRLRSWLGHLKKGGYIEATRLNGLIRVRVKHAASEPQAPESRFFTVARLQKALKDQGNTEAFEAALRLYKDPVIRSALAGALAPPAEEIRRSRTALFLYLLKRHDHD